MGRPRSFCRTSHAEGIWRRHVERSRLCRWLRQPIAAESRLRGRHNGPEGRYGGLLYIERLPLRDPRDRRRASRIRNGSRRSAKCHGSPRNGTTFWVAISIRSVQPAWHSKTSHWWSILASADARQIVLMNARLHPLGFSPGRPTATESGLAQDTVSGGVTRFFTIGITSSGSRY
jgi:hypothetical protein